MRLTWIAMLGGLLVAGPALAAQAPSNAVFQSLVSEFLEDYFRDNPTQAGDLGLHQFDDRIEDASRDAVLAEAARFKRYRERFTAIDGRSRQAMSSSYRPACHMASTTLPIT